MTVREPEIWSVTQLTRRIKSLLEEAVGYIWVAGEVSNFRVSPSGHAYFTLKDESSQVDGIMFRGRLARLPFEPESGIQVIAYGLVSVYERRGNYQLVCEEMHPKGVGALQLAFEKLRKKLEEEGLFAEEHKKPLPLLPRRIGVVTSPSGAAIRDILNVVGRRFANVHVLLYPARVQGDEAAAELVAGVRALDKLGVDVIIVGRGGGSLEDLWPFNEEGVVRAVYEAATPIISAVGHEIDFVLTDFAADVRAPTPSAAAELVVQEQEALARKVKECARRLGKALEHKLERARDRLAVAKSSYWFLRPEELTRQRRQQCDELRIRLEAALRQRAVDARLRVNQAARSLVLLSPTQQIRRATDRLAAQTFRLRQLGPAVVERFRGRLRPLTAQLDALSPLAILNRGYAIAWKQPEHVLVREAAALSVADRLLLRFGQGSAQAVVEQIQESDDGRTSL